MLNPHLDLSLQPPSSCCTMSLSLWRPLMFGDHSAFSSEDIYVNLAAAHMDV